jgi:hypothetical protein
MSGPITEQIPVAIVGALEPQMSYSNERSLLRVR